MTPSGRGLGPLDSPIDTSGTGINSGCQPTAANSNNYSHSPMKCFCTESGSDKVLHLARYHRQKDEDVYQYGNS